MVIATNPTIARIPHLGCFLAEYPRAVLGWGRKASGRRAQTLAWLLHRPCILLEDGFIRSVARGDPPLSLIIDDRGCYYDASAPSRIETLTAAGISAGQAARTRALIGQWQSQAISKYNHSPEFAGDLPARYVLVADQTLGDLSIRMGLATPHSFVAMIEAALAENVDSQVLVKVHPDVFSHAKRGCFPLSLAHPRITVIGSDCHIARLLTHADAVYAVTSLIGFEALLWGKPVRCFGMPFYAGWGLTSDVLAAPARRGAATLEALVHAALVGAARYVDPASGALWQAEDAISFASAGRRARLAAAAA